MLRVAFACSHKLFGAGVVVVAAALDAAELLVAADVDMGAVDISASSSNASVFAGGSLATSCIDIVGRSGPGWRRLY